MADDNVDWRFLGRQVQILQGDVRDLRAAQLRTDSELAGVKADLARFQADVAVKFESVEARLDRVEGEMREMRTQLSKFERYVDARFDQLAETAATNFQVLLEALKGR